MYLILFLDFRTKCGIRVTVCRRIRNEKRKVFTVGVLVREEKENLP
jgi:hypothetical protein